MQVTAHHEELLTQAAGVSNLQGSLKTVRDGLNDIDLSLEKYVDNAIPRTSELNNSPGSALKSVTHTRPFKVVCPD
jgi:hypothetical protein